MIEFPCLTPIFVPANQVVANDYNPNKVDPEEMRLLQLSISEDGLTQAVVVIYDPESDRYIVVDGFHRYLLLTRKFKCSHIPVVVIDKPLAQRMASTVRHNRARGKHTTGLMEGIVRRLDGWTDSEIARKLGMKAEELLRLKQGGIVEFYKHREYSRAWVWVEEGKEEVGGMKDE